MFINWIKRQKSNMCAGPANFFVGAGFERAKSGNQKTSQKAITDFHER